jgi:hypothetical protein
MPIHASLILEYCPGDVTNSLNANKGRIIFGASAVYIMKTV